MNTPQAPVMMEPTMSAEMPAWPEKPTGAPHQIAALVKLVGYERSLRLAWEARARLLERAARATLVEQRREFAYGDIEDLDRLEEALALVGPLPPMDGER